MAGPVTTEIDPDDVTSGGLNCGPNAREVGPGGDYRLTVVHRARATDEGPDDGSADASRAGLVSLRCRPTRDAVTERVTATIDLTRFSSWARASRSARVGFGADRHPERIKSALILGTTSTLTSTSHA